MLTRLREKNPLPSGAIPVAVGLVVNGLTTYAFFGIASRHFGTSVEGAAAFSALSALWSLLFGLGNGAMQPLEQEVARAVSARRARGLGAGPVLKRAMLIGAAFTGVLLVVLGLTYSVVRTRLLGDRGTLVACLAIGLVGFCVGHLTRGAFSSHGRFRSYAVYFGGEGAFRFVGAVLLIVFGASALGLRTELGLWGLALCLSPLLAAGVSLARQRGMLTPGPPAEWGELTTNLGWLLLGAGSLSLLLQSGTLAVQWFGADTDPSAAGQFQKGLLIARVPLFLFQAVLASLLPKLARLATEGKLREFRSSLRSLVLLILGGGAVASIGAGLVGPWAASRLFGEGSIVGGRDLALLAVSHVLIMAAICLDQGLIALGGHSRMAIGWLMALITFSVATAIGTDLFLRVEIGLVLAGMVSLVWMYRSISVRMRQQASAPPGAASLASEVLI